MAYRVLGSWGGLVPARAGSYSLAKSARTTYAAATTATATASGGRRSDLAAGAEGASAFAIIVAHVDKTTVRERITARAAEGHVWVVQISRREVPLDAGGCAAY